MHQMRVASTLSRSVVAARFDEAVDSILVDSGEFPEDWAIVVCYVAALVVGRKPAEEAVDPMVDSEEVRYKVGIGFDLAARRTEKEDIAAAGMDCRYTETAVLVAVLVAVLAAVLGGPDPDNPE